MAVSTGLPRRSSSSASNGVVGSAVSGTSTACASSWSAAKAREDRGQVRVVDGREGDPVDVQPGEGGQIGQ
ncbi:hypothetical protein ABZ342_25410 [Amycolatopsis sp. NPDC005961]|uniref:hypothetical protein n=1 Tax=Amycolatopsis sp. NPDC005961 TaxID=3156720 RepID=UPI0033EE71FC